MTKRFIFDISSCQPIKTNKFHGGGTYGFIVLKKLLETNYTNISIYYNNNKFLPDDIKQVILNNEIEIIDSNEISLFDLYNRGNYTHIYTPVYNEKRYKTILQNNIPLIITLHGLRALEVYNDKYEIYYATNLKETFKALLKQTFVNKIKKSLYKKRYKNIFENHNVKIITVSNHSKYSFKTFFPKLKDDKIIVRYSPNTSPKEISKIKINEKEKEKYYLIISANRWLKNSYRAIKAFDKLFSQNLLSSTKVYIVGLSKNHKLARNIKNKKFFSFFSYLDRSELEKIYSKAYCLVYPSLNEGFGYPPLEAMRYKVPVISSGVSAIPEICGSSVIYANPYSIEEISNRILQIENKDIHEKYSELSKKQYEEIRNKQDEDLDLLIKDIINF